MSLLSTEKPKQLNFSRHSAFEREVKKARVLGLEKGMEAFERLCEVHFHPTSPRGVIAPGKLHHLYDGDGWELWKIEMVVPGLRMNQMPRVWFAKSGTTFVYLAMGSHTDNYQDNERQASATERATECF